MTSINDVPSRTHFGDGTQGFGDKGVDSGDMKGGVDAPLIASREPPSGDGQPDVWCCSGESGCVYICLQRGTNACSEGTPSSSSWVG